MNQQALDTAALQFIQDLIDAHRAALGQLLGIEIPDHRPVEEQLSWVFKSIGEEFP